MLFVVAHHRSLRTIFVIYFFFIAFIPGQTTVPIANKMLTRCKKKRERTDSFCAPDPPQLNSLQPKPQLDPRALSGKVPFLAHTRWDAKRQRHVGMELQYGRDTVMAFMEFDSHMRHLGTTRHVLKGKIVRDRLLARPDRVGHARAWECELVFSAANNSMPTYRMTH